MRKKNPVQTKLTEFTYEHKKLNGRLLRIKKSADELSGLLNNMTPKAKTEKEK